MIRLQDLDAHHNEPSETPLKKWRCKFDANTLNTMDFVQYFQMESPHFLNVESSELINRCIFNEQGAKVEIIDAIEEFICGENPQNLFDKLKTEDNAPSVCGRVFKMGEPTYSCRECGMDSTCVLCVGCFKQSAHRHHKYKMGTSGGGGCCDCGDNEAWKRYPYCDEHILGTEKKTESTIVTERMKECCRIVFQGILFYCTKSLEMEYVASSNCFGSEMDEDLFCTVLYNDETHTFEQVIQTLTRYVGCQQKEAIDYVTSIDREGRAVVKCAPFQKCEQLKNEIERQSNRSVNLPPKQLPLKVSVLHKNAVAQQQFAIQLLAWFQEFLTRHAIFRKIFCDIVVKKMEGRGCGSSYLKNILEYDSKLWKTARSSWHRLLISGMLMEYENKKTLAIVFTKNYAQIMQQFIQDDHDHSYSIVSLSVQLFTVPSIAQLLIANEGAFHKLMHTFYVECVEKYTKKKVLQFEKNTTNLNEFKRAVQILFDVRYLLSFKPDVWTLELRREFLHGVEVLMKLLGVMQGMDAVHRQTGSHMEYEPEWESAFNLHIKLASVISLVLDWCGTDKLVLEKVYQRIQTELAESDFILSQTTTEVKELADHSASCLMYDVSTKDVSIHLPLSRFFAGIYLHLEKFGLIFDTLHNTITRRTPEQLMEPVLCTQTMISQVHSGMWRRNGYSLLNQLYFYRNVKCRSEMLDRDFVVLQIGASLIESNEYLIHLLNKYNLVNWASPDFENAGPSTSEEDSLRQVTNMVDEFLEILIIIIGERYVPGIGDVTEEEKTKKEIIQQLCIKPFSHSELSRTLPDSQYEMGIENVINTVAIFKKPTQSDKKGVYELKPEYYDDYNMYFYHYTKEERSRSEEAQRKRRSAKGELACCPPPVLPKLTDTFANIANLLQCDVMLLIMQIILKRSLDLKARSFAESHLQKILHLIGFALQDEETRHYSFLQFYERASKWGILQLMEELLTSPRVEVHRELILWTINKYKELQPVTSADVESESDEEDDVTIVPKSAVSEQAEKEERARLAAARRAKILAQMDKAQKSFMSSNAEMFGMATTSSDRSSQGGMDWQALTEESKSIACLGPNRKINITDNQQLTCILCSEESHVSKVGPCMVYSAFIQKSSILSRYQKTNAEGQLQYVEPNIRPSPHTGTCGHVMHFTCWKDYFNNELAKENRRPYRNRSTGNFDIEKKEFLCPLCRCLSNTVLAVTPALPSFNNISADNDTTAVDDIVSFETFLDIIKDYTEALHNQDVQVDLSDGIEPVIIFPALKDTLAKYQIEMSQFSKLNEPQDEVFGISLADNINFFMDSVRRVSRYPVAPENIESFLVTWLSCAYTIESLEMLLRALDKPLKGQLSLRQTSCLSSLVRICGLLVASHKDVDPKLVYHMRDIYDAIFTKKGLSILEWDVFGMLVSLVFITPCTIYTSIDGNAIPKGEMMEYYILKLTFIVNMVKIIITFDMNEDNKDNDDEQINQMETDDCDVNRCDNDKTDTKINEDGMEATDIIGDIDDNDLNSNKLLNFYMNYNIYMNNDETQTKTDIDKHLVKIKLINAIKEQSQTFLRCASLLYLFMTDVEMPNAFETINGDTFDLMCEYLGLTTDIESYFINEKLMNLMCDMASHSRSRSVAHMSPVPPIRQLVSLPDDYSDLINSVSLFTCPNNDRDDSRNPTMCLVCGDILCSQTYCCQKDLDKMMVGACTYHAHTCGAGVGIFLRIRECEILLLGLYKGCFVTPPYLDEYGETDQGLRRGNPLHLCKERYKKLHLMWLSHGLHEEIARSSEVPTNALATQWHHL